MQAQLAHGQYVETTGQRWPEPLVLLAEGEVAAARGDVAGGADLQRRAVALAEAQGSFGLARRIAAHPGGAATSSATRA